MPISISEIQELKIHLSGIMERADHHAQSVYKIAPLLCGLIIWKADAIEVRKYEGNNANMVWIKVGASRYALVYNHAKQEIELRKRTQQGSVITSFSNDSDAEFVIREFSNL